MVQDTILTNTPPHGIGTYSSPEMRVMTISGEIGFAASPAQYNEVSNDSYTIAEEAFQW
mgnify:FL=1